jgi:hypothetical protein
MKAHPTHTLISDDWCTYCTYGWESKINCEAVLAYPCPFSPYEWIIKLWLR